MFQKFAQKNFSNEFVIDFFVGFHFIHSIRTHVNIVDDKNELTRKLDRIFVWKNLVKENCFFFFYLLRYMYKDVVDIVVFHINDKRTGGAWSEIGKREVRCSPGQTCYAIVDKSVSKKRAFSDCCTEFSGVANEGRSASVTYMFGRS